MRVLRVEVLGLIHATSLWSDELYTVGKSFQPDYGALLAMLLQGTIRPLYYSLLWLWGAAVGQSAVSLRLLSWLAYGLGAVVMVSLAPPAGSTPTPSAPWLCWRFGPRDQPTGLLLVVEAGFNSARALKEARLLISQMSSTQAVGVVLIGAPLPEELSSSVVG